MSTDQNIPWNCIETSASTGRQLWERLEEFEHTGNNEGTMTHGYRVTDADGNELLKTSTYVDWEYHGWIEAEFIREGTAIRITASDDSESVHEIG